MINKVRFETTRQNSKLFKRNSKAYKLHRPPKPIVVNRISAALSLSNYQTGRCLDIGCGNGSYIHALSVNHALEFIGLDASFEMLSHWGHKKHFETPVMASFNRSLPFNDNSFQVVISIDSIHFSNNLDLLLQEVARVLCPGGIFIVASHTVADLERQTLGVFFPSTVKIESRKAKQFSKITPKAKMHGLKEVARHCDVERFWPSPAYVKLFANKCATALNAISVSEFRRGLKCLTAAKGSKKRVAANSYTTLIFRRIPND